ncbi:hypothetical protein Goklo_012451 [Gossypium klotzschianum]|uniref:Uncharacterized protein n=1 Tax=Gossypium klotzschianum TaxID=34286 RepID=A0A7J8VDD3_9ROSI|nr:hypothetical protein [Gossypium klotzschianum]
MNKKSQEFFNLAVFLRWFYPLSQWLEMITSTLNQIKNPSASVVIIFYKLQYFMQNGASTQLGSFPTAWIHKTYSAEIDSDPHDYKALKKYLCQLNRIIRTEIWPPVDVLAHWDFNPESLTSDQLKLKAFKEYQENIPDPKEWSQDYSWFCSQAWTKTLAWEKDKITPMDLYSSPESRWEEKCYRAKLRKEIRIEEPNITSDASTEYSD